MSHTCQYTPVAQTTQEAETGGPFEAMDLRPPEHRSETQLAKTEVQGKCKKWQGNRIEWTSQFFGIWQDEGEVWRIQPREGVRKGVSTNKTLNWNLIPG